MSEPQVTSIGHWHRTVFVSMNYDQDTTRTVKAIPRMTAASAMCTRDTQHTDYLCPRNPLPLISSVIPPALKVNSRSSRLSWQGSEREAGSDPSVRTT